MKVLEIAYHRNGVGGEPFYAVRFTLAEEAGEFLGIVFQAPMHCAVINISRLPEHGVEFGANSWRGDRYNAELRAAIEAQAGEAW